MTNITGVGFSNFRVFNNPAFFELAPISIFTGTNSSGKSSVFKGLKLLNNNFDNINFLRFSGEGHKLGTYHLSKSKNSKSDVIRYVLGLDNKYLLVIDYEPINQGNNENGYWKHFFITIGTENKKEYAPEELVLSVSQPDEEIPELRIFLNIRYLIKLVLEESKSLSLSASNSVFNGFLKKRKEEIQKWRGEIVSIDKLKALIPSLDLDSAKSLSIKIEEELLPKLSTRYIELHNKEVYSQEEKSFYEILSEIRFPDNLQNVLCKSLLKTEKIDPGILFQLGDSSVVEVLNDTFVQEISKESKSKALYFERGIKQAIKRIFYLESIRANSQRLYSNQSQGTSFNELLLDLGSKWMYGEQNKFLKKWLQKMGIGDGLKISRIKGIATEVTIIKEEEEIDLIDLGYGVTQFLPILLFICSKLNIKEELSVISVQSLFDEEDNVVDLQNLVRNEAALLLIEEPESNLHPRLQSLLADFFLDVAKTFEVTLLIETHSEYLIRRLQVLTASGDLNSKDSVIYYLDGNIRSDHEKFIRKININPDGSLTNDFGTGFTDEATNWKMELLRLKNSQLQNVN